METAEQREAAFNKAFTELLEKFEAEFEIGEENGSGTATVSMESVYSVHGGILEKEYCDFYLNTYLP